MTGKIGWDDQGDSYTYWDRIRDERRQERKMLEAFKADPERLDWRLAYVRKGEQLAENEMMRWPRKD